MSPTEKPRKRVGNPPQKLQKSSRKWMYIALVLIVVAIAVVAFVILQNSASDTHNNNGSTTGNPIAVFDTSLGTFKVELFIDKVPITAGNFIDLSNSGYYNGVIFHRVIPNFMIQGGDPLGDGTGGHAAKYHEGYGTSTTPDTWVIPDEFLAELSNVRGTISMANRGPNTGGSQFFINVVDNTNLDYNKEPLTSAHAVFGKVIEGMNVVDEISQVDTGSDTKPDVDVIIYSITIENY
jgi:cyclophilin family peptidyl-prolyl cis-trans isomerase